MGQGTPLRLLITGFLALPFLLGGCKLDEALLPTEPTGNDAVSGDGIVIPTIPGSSSSITAPIIADPLSGSTVSARRPELSVLNSAQNISAPSTYLFQISEEASFASLEAQSPQVPEGQNGTTSWTVDTPLTDGRYFWRVRSRSGTHDSPFSSTADFTVGAGGGGGGNAPPPNNNPPPSPTAGTIVSDPLIGGSVGQVAGGQFTSTGWQVTSPGNFIRYEVPPMAQGWVEFNTSGLQEINSSPDQFMLFGMWDPSAGDYRANRFRVHLQKLHPNPHNPPYLRLRWIANGEQHDEGNNFLEWDPRRTYHWRLEWGPSGGGNSARVYLDGRLMITVNYNRAYRPNVLYIELGIGERGESIVGAKYSNLQIGN
jgi:hypothetical protein